MPQHLLSPSNRINPSWRQQMEPTIRCSQLWLVQLPTRIESRMAFGRFPGPQFRIMTMAVGRAARRDRNQAGEFAAIVVRSCGGGGANGIVTALAGMQSPQGATPTKPRAEPHARSECCAALGHRAQPSVGRGVRPPTRRPPAETEIRPRMNSGGTRNMCARPMVSCPFRAIPRRGHRFPG